MIGESIITDLNYSMYKYVPSDPYMNDLISDLEYLAEALVHHKNICKAMGVGNIVSDHMQSNANIITKYADNMIIQHTQTFIQNCINKYPLINHINYGIAGKDTLDTIAATKVLENIHKTIECEHEWSEDDSFNYQCIQCNRSIKSSPCNYCGHNDAIRRQNDYQCTKCKQCKSRLEQPVEFRAYQDAQDAIRKGTADQSDPIIKYTQNCIDLQTAYYKKEYQKILDEQNAALLEHINNK